VVWEGELKRQRWNLFSLHVLTRLATATSVKIDVRISAELPQGRSSDQINASLYELAIEGKFTKKAK
jgi:hypothetical protein